MFKGFVMSSRRVSVLALEHNIFKKKKGKTHCILIIHTR